MIGDAMKRPISLKKFGHVLPVAKVPTGIPILSLSTGVTDFLNILRLSIRVQIWRALLKPLEWIFKWISFANATYAKKSSKTGIEGVNIFFNIMITTFLLKNKMSLKRVHQNSQKARRMLPPLSSINRPRQSLLLSQRLL
jgi:hypothetical protein